MKLHTYLICTCKNHIRDIHILATMDLGSDLEALALGEKLTRLQDSRVILIYESVEKRVVFKCDKEFGQSISFPLKLQLKNYFSDASFIDDIFKN